MSIKNRNIFREKIICPHCDKNISRQDSGCYCNNCHKGFFIDDGVFFTNNSDVKIFKETEISPSKLSIMNYSIATRLIDRIVLGLLDLKKEDVLVDIGCGTGNLLKKVSFFTDNACGLDNSAESIKRARSLSACPLIVCDAEKTLPLKSKIADKAVSSVVIEHIHNLDCFLSETDRILKPGGVFVLSTNNDECFLAHTKLARLGHEDPENGEYHVRDGFSAEELSMLLKKHNFKIEDIKYTLFPFSEIFMGLTKFLYLFKTSKKSLKNQAEVFKIEKDYFFQLLKIFFPFIYFFSLLEEFIFNKLLRSRFIYRKCGNVIAIRAIKQ